MALASATIIASTACSNKQATTESVHERLLPLQGAYNARDLGGYQTKDGKTVKWGKIFRSGDLDKLTDADLEYLDSLQVRTIIDFRDSTEIAAAPDRTPLSLLHAYTLSVSAGNMIDLHNITTPGRSEKILEEVNRFFVTHAQDTYKEFFRIMMDESNAPLLFHCSAGKDRTGYAAAMILSALGVEREIIIQDYLLSAEYLKEKYAEEIKRIPQLAPLMTVKREYLEAAFEVIDKEHGGVENYLVDSLGVDLKKMKELYLE